MPQKSKRLTDVPAGPCGYKVGVPNPAVRDVVPLKKRGDPRRTGSSTGPDGVSAFHATKQDSPNAR